jgi:hypothetical protein
MKYLVLLLNLFLLLATMAWGVTDTFTVTQTRPMGVLDRDSVAYMAGTEYAADTQRTTSGLVVSTSDGALVTGGGVGGANVVPQCVAGGYLYGIEGNLTYGRICKSADGVTWARTASSQSVSSITATPAGNLFAVDNDGKKWYRSTNGGESWTDVTPTGDNAPSSTAVFAMRWCYRNNGPTMILIEYGSSVRFGGRYIFRSTNDGATWTRCYDAASITAVEGNQITHWHQIGYHAKTNRWIATAGDGAARRTVVYSDNDGLTWSVLIVPGKYYTQPLGGAIDYGDSTYLLYGEDGYGSIHKFDVTNGQSISKYSGFDRNTGKYYVFDVAYVNGLFYAFKGTTTAIIYDMAILVSPDGDNWTVYHRFNVADKISQVYFAGYFNGLLHCYAMNEVNVVYKHFKISPARVSQTSGVVVEPAATNLLTADMSSAETSAALWVNNATNWTSIGRSNDTALHGSYSVKVVMPDGHETGSTTLNADISLTVGKTYVASAYIKGTNTLVSIRPYWRPTGGTGQKFVASDATYWVDSNWKKITTLPFTVASGEGDFYRLYFTVYGTTAGYTGPAKTLYIDCVQFTEVPNTDWQIGGTARVADTYTETATTGKLFTDVFAVQANCLPLYLTGTIPIKTWALDANNKIVIAWDADNSKFTLTRTIAGSAQTTVSSAATYFFPQSCIKFILRVSGSSIKLDIQNGSSVATLSDDGMTSLLDAMITGTYGTFPMVVLDGWTYDRFVPLWMSDDDVAKVMNLTQPDCMKSNDVKGFFLRRRFVY